MNEIDFYHKPHYIKSFVNNLKHHQTTAEKILREYLKAKKFYGLKFHRQKPLFVYREQSWVDRFFIADFYHHPSKLIIEIDGCVHNQKDIKAYDKLRTYLLKEHGYKIIRFTNNMVESDILCVLKKIYAFTLTPSLPTADMPYPSSGITPSLSLPLPPCGTGAIEEGGHSPFVSEGVRGSNI